MYFTRGFLLIWGKSLPIPLTNHKKKISLYIMMLSFQVFYTKKYYLVIFGALLD